MKLKCEDCDEEMDFVLDLVCQACCGHEIKTWDKKDGVMVDPICGMCGKELIDDFVGKDVSQK
jgi:hypothetical protein